MDWKSKDVLAYVYEEPGPTPLRIDCKERERVGQSAAHTVHCHLVNSLYIIHSRLLNTNRVQHAALDGERVRKNRDGLERDLGF